VKPGFWMVRCCRHCPEVAARIFLADHEPGLPENKIDQPYWQGQLGLDLVDPARIWQMVWFCEASPEEKARLADPPLSDRAPRSRRLPALTTAPLAKWKQERARRIVEFTFDAQIAWLRWAEKNAPNHPEFIYRKPVDPAAVPIPQFSRRA
jgi:uncharacterized caspase-like protein